MLPALSGVLSWIGRRSPARMWAAEQLTRGRVFVQAVSASLIDGVSGGAVMAALGVFADWAALQVAGFEPSISRELDVVDASFGSMIGETLTRVGVHRARRRIRGRGVRSVPRQSDRLDDRRGDRRGHDCRQPIRKHLLPALVLIAGMAPGRRRSS